MAPYDDEEISWTPGLSYSVERHCRNQIEGERGGAMARRTT
jgi:hypothetical protein